ncbi:MAG TPA: diaminopimelate epimerase [Candidatus Paceibacterota bacterium]|jgi:diaminopimelate epimerase|nr:diaminopimelate epimerase [Candidatus Paceibacterota bacterium]
MKEFYKYHGAGNDFIIIDNREKSFDINDKELIKLLCHRRFGIGADGIILLEKDPECDFKMVYINNDGSTGSMCGNGGRCIVDFAHNILKIIKNPKKITFLAVDGKHEAEILNVGLVKLKMQDVNEIGKRNGLDFLYSGTTPHNIMFVKDLEKFPVVSEGRKIRNSDPDGVNTNFVELKNGVFHVRTYERGVEDETLACGTGATSVAITAHHLGKLKENICQIKMPGGDLMVEFEKIDNGSYRNIWLTGPAKCVFKGEAYK